MFQMSSTSSAARTALIYITLGTLLLIWTGVWFIYLRNNSPEAPASYYFCGGFAITGMALVVIGLGVGRIGRSARKADVPGATAIPMTPEVAVPVTGSDSLTTVRVTSPTTSAPLVTHG